MGYIIFLILVWGIVGGAGLWKADDYVYRRFGYNLWNWKVITAMVIGGLSVLFPIVGSFIAASNGIEFEINWFYPTVFLVSFIICYIVDKMGTNAKWATLLTFLRIGLTVSIVAIVVLIIILFIFTGGGGRNKEERDKRIQKIEEILKNKGLWR